MEKHKLQEEALRRLSRLQITPERIVAFKLKKQVFCSVNGFGYKLDNQMKTIVQDFESEHNCLVYHAIMTDTEFGRLLSLLYVSPNQENWNLDREDITSRQQFVFVYNLDYPELSEFGTICFVNKYGSLVRTA